MSPTSAYQEIWFDFWLQQGMLGEGKSHKYKLLFVLFSREIEKKWYSLTRKYS